jgi:photosystem II stability/assembly factor-like uncharacterized protein
MATSDGGRSWAQVWSSGAQLSQMSWAAADLGLASLVNNTCLDRVPPAGQLVPHCPGEVVRTTDGGRQWVTALHTSGPVVGLAAGTRTWWAAQIVTSSLPSKGGFQSSHLLIWASTDQGQKWATRGQVTAPLAFLGPRTSATILPEDRGQLWLGVVDPDSCAMHGCSTADAWHSNDGGARWSLASSPLITEPRGCGPHAEMPMAASPNAGTYISSGVNLAACAPPGSVLDRWAGKTWTLVHTWDLAAVTAISWPSVATGYVLVDGALSRTTDGGRTWSQSWPTLAPVGPLAALNTRLALAGDDVTDPGVILRTNDGGATWTALADLPGEITALDFPTPDTGLLVLLNPVANTWELESSTDGGHHWQPQGRLPAPRAPGQVVEGVSGLWAASSAAALALTTSGAGVYDLGGVAPGELWSTTDGGRSWAHIATVPGGQYWSLEAAGFSRLANGKWWGVVEGGSPRLTTELTAGGRTRWSTEPRFPGVSALQVLGAHLIIGRGANPDGTDYMVMSTDGGAHWARRPLPSPGYQGGLGISDILAFVNAYNGWWSAGGYVWTTTDGGSAWAMVTAP